MAKVNVKELKDDALVKLEVNKAYYYMVKNALFYLFKNATVTENEKESILKGLMQKPYPEMSEWEKAFYTLTLLVAEIEKVAAEQDLYNDVELDLPEEVKQD